MELDKHCAGCPSDFPNSPESDITLFRKLQTDNLLNGPGGEVRTTLKMFATWPSAPFPYYLVVGGAAIGSSATLAALTKLKPTLDRD